MPDGSLVTPAVRLSFTLDQTGHTVFGWDAENDDWVIPLIRRKMEQGFTFYAVRIVGRGPGTRERRLTKVEQIGPTRRVLVHDPDAQKLFNEGRIGLRVEPAGENEFVFERGRRITDPDEAAREDTMSMRASRGG